MSACRATVCVPPPPRQETSVPRERGSSNRPAVEERRREPFNREAGLPTHTHSTLSELKATELPPSEERGCCDTQRTSENGACDC